METFTFSHYPLYSSLRWDRTDAPVPQNTWKRAFLSNTNQVNTIPEFAW